MSGLETDRNANPLKEKVETAVSKKIYNDKECIKLADFLSPMVADLSPDSNADRKLQNKLRNYELRLNQEYLSEFEKINDIVQKFDEIANAMNGTCMDLYQKMEKVKLKSTSLVQETINLNEKKAMIEARSSVIDEFLDSYSLTPADVKVLIECEQTGRLSEGFFEVLEKAEKVRNECRKMVQEQGHVAAFEIIEQMQSVQERGYRIVCDNLKREMANLTPDCLPKKILIQKALEILRKNETLFQVALEQYASCRSQDILNRFLEATRTLDASAVVGDMLTVIHEITESEKELFTSICNGVDGKQVEIVIDEAMNVLASPFKIRAEQLITAEKDPITICKLGNILLHYSEKFEVLISKENNISKMLEELIKTVKQLCTAGINNHVDTLMRKMSVPNHDLLPVAEVRACVALFQGLISTSEKDYSADHHNLLINPQHIYEIVLEPLIQTVQLSATRLRSSLDVAVFTINCLTVIRSCVADLKLVQNRLEMINAMIDSNADVLVSVQLSDMLDKSGLLEIYQKMTAIHGNEKPISTIEGLDQTTISNGLVVFTQFLHNYAQLVTDYQFVDKILGAEERSKIRERTVSEFMKVYIFVVEKMENGYENLHFLPIDRVEKLLKFE